MSACQGRPSAAGLPAVPSPRPRALRRVRQPGLPLAARRALRPRLSAVVHLQTAGDLARVTTS